MVVCGFWLCFFFKKKKNTHTQPPIYSIWWTKNQHLDRLVKLACRHPHSMSFCAHETAEFSLRIQFAVVSVSWQSLQCKLFGFQLCLTRTILHTKEQSRAVNPKHHRAHGPRVQTYQRLQLGKRLRLKKSGKLFYTTIEQLNEKEKKTKHCTTCLWVLWVRSRSAQSLDSGKHRKHHIISSEVSLIA